MKLIFNRQYKSIQRAPASELPSLTIITGENGTGKTHFLQALMDGSISIEGMPGLRTRYYTWGNMLPSNDLNVVPKNTNSSDDSTFFARLSAGALADVLQQINYELNDQTITVTKEHLLACVTKDQSFDALPEVVKSIISHTLSLYHNCIIKKLTKGLFSRQVSEMCVVTFTWPDVQEKYGMTNIPGAPAILLDSLQCALLLDILKEGNKPFFDISREDNASFYPLTDKYIDPFQGSLADIFAAYIREREKNDLNTARFKRGDAESFLTEQEFLRDVGLPPWEIVNRVLEETKLPFRFKKPGPDAHKQLELQLIHTTGNIEIKFSDLSSGERILISLTQFLFLSEYQRQKIDMPDIFLLDEVDASLHPVMTADLLRIIEKVLVGKYKRLVVMVTHSASTIALAPEESIYVMDASTKLLRKASRDEGVRVLTAGVPTLSINLENRRQVFVESRYDADFFGKIADLARPYLLPEISLTFIESGQQKEGGCARVRQLVNQLAGNQSVFGIIDWDGHNSSTRHLRVLGENVRHSIENYLFDPVLLAALLLREKLLTRAELELAEGQTHVDLAGFDDARLQVVVDKILARLDLSLNEGDKLVTSRYANGRTVQVPARYLQKRGHDLEEHIKAKFAALGKFRTGPSMKMEILVKVLDELPGFLPADLIELLRGIQRNS